MSLIATIKATAASITGALAAFDERMPGLSQLTISAGGITATVIPAPQPQAPAAAPTGKCSTCGRGP